MLCDLCLGDLDAKLGEQWEIEVDKIVRSQNYYAFSTSRFTYTRHVDEWEELLSEEVQRLAIWEATTKRRCIFTRLIGPRGRIYDTFNLVGGLKPVVDALVRLNVLIDDDPARFEGYVRQRRHPHHGLVIAVADVLP